MSITAKYRIFRSGFELSYQCVSKTKERAFGYLSNVYLANENKGYLVTLFILKVN